MISLTVTGASFTNPEQKQKTEFTDSFESQTIQAVQLTANYDFSVNDFSSNVFVFDNTKAKSKVKAFDAVMPQLYIRPLYVWHDVFYKEKLNKNLRLKVLENQEILKFPMIYNS
jgi:hypothetical protein